MTTEFAFVAVVMVLVAAATAVVWLRGGTIALRMRRARPWTPAPEVFDVARFRAAWVGAVPGEDGGVAAAHRPPFFGARNACGCGDGRIGRATGPLRDLGLDAADRGWAELAALLVDSTPDVRRTAVDSHLAALLDARAARRAVRRGAWVRRRLRWPLRTLAYTTVWITLTVATAGTLVAAIVLVPFAGALAWTTTVYVRSARRLGLRAGVADDAAVLCLLPPLALRADTRLVGRLAADRHALALLVATGARDAAHDVAAQALRECVYPLAGDPGPCCATAACVRDAWRRALERWIAAQRPPRDPFAPPARESAAARAWCPRCHTQYARDEGECSDCDGLALVPFASDDERPESRARTATAHAKPAAATRAPANAARAKPAKKRATGRRRRGR